MDVLWREEKSLSQDYKVSRGNFFSCFQVFFAKIFSRDGKKKLPVVARFESKTAWKKTIKMLFRSHFLITSIDE